MNASEAEELSPSLPIETPVRETVAPAKRGRVGAFQSRNFRLLWTGLIIANSGSWMATTAERRSDPRALMSEVRSVIMLGMNYGVAGDPLAILEARDRGAISVYAQGDDYHDIIKPKLKALGHQTRVMEQTSGLQAIVRTKNGWIGGADPRREGTVRCD